MKNNGFTLVELLAIIVILGLIAVRIVPKITSIIETSKMELAENSAYGYKDAVEKFYYYKSMKKEKISLEGLYEVNNVGKLLNDTDTYDIDFDGDPPKGGVLIYTDNKLNSGCLTINKYKVEFNNGDVSNTSKGSCNINDYR